LEGVEQAIMDFIDKASKDAPNDEVRAARYTTIMEKWAAWDNNTGYAAMGYMPQAVMEATKRWTNGTVRCWYQVVAAWAEAMRKLLVVRKVKFLEWREEMGIPPHEKRWSRNVSETVEPDVGRMP
jgi:hypothetical protein